ncbi:guanylate kinase [Microvirga sp. 17 mud 1-3]|uniref:guanylate kinase n=1 Tax=Microvirga sp. 17 mud 1-3 TaxID=2082949 RepID=UPI000D6BA6B0|nr:guanylate kinase [Microvirga sp. 17 mud 1-3]AWM87497.1 guanylate kinase [Microvirga sp. 17 mud 1-3]
MTERTVVELKRRGLLLILSSPSGAGKSTLTRNLVREDRGIRLSISVTTRTKRPSEINGVHYNFMESVADFEEQRDRGDLLEWAQVHGNYYGTPRKPVEQALARGEDMMFDIDWQGTRQIVEKMRDDVVSVFILPPSMAELKARLERRAEDTPEVIARRLRNARDEIAQWAAYDYVLVNDDLDRTFGDLKSILAAERLRRERQVELGPFIDDLLAAPVE